MASAGSLTEHLVLSTLLSGPAMTEKKKFGWGLTALSVFLALAGTGFFIIAGYQWLSAYYGVLYGSLYMALITLAFALLFFLAGNIITIRNRRFMKTYHQGIAENLHTIISSISEELEEPIRENPKTAALIAAMAGFMAAQKYLH